MRLRHLIVLIVATVALAPAAAGQAQEISMDGRLAADHILDWERVGDPQISPDGAQVIYVRSLVNTMDDRWESQLWIMNADGSALLRFNKEYHGTGSMPSNFIRRQLYIVDWFNQHRKGATEMPAQ